MRIRTGGTHRRTQENPWLYVPQPITHPDVRLFCFPYAGGSAEIFHQWSEGLPENIEMCALQYPGRSTRIKESPLTSMSTLIEGLHTAIQPFIDIPYAFFGHSMGTLVLYELVQQLYRQGSELPVHLFVSGRKAPQIPDLFPPIRDLTDEELILMARTSPGTSEEMLQNPDFMKPLLPMIRGDLTILETWRLDPESPLLPIPIWAFGGINDSIASREQMKAWSLCTEREYKMFIFPGDHFFAFDVYSRDAILRLITTALASWKGSGNC